MDGKNGEGSPFLEDSFLTQDITVYANWVNFTVTDMPEEYLPYKVYLVESIPSNYLGAVGAIAVDPSASGTIENGVVIWGDPQQRPFIGTFTVIISDDVGYSILRSRLTRMAECQESSVGGLIKKIGLR